MEHEALKRSRVHPGRAGPAGPTQPPGRAPAWASGPTSSEGAVPVPGPEEAGAHPSALRGGEGKPPPAGLAGGDRADPPAGSAKADPAGIAYTDQPLGGGACRDGEGGKKAEAAVCQLAFFGTSTECHCHQESRRRNAGRCPTACARRRVGEASEPQGLLHGLPGDLVELLPVVPPHLGSVHVSSAFIVGL